MIKLKKINDEKVKPIKTIDNSDPRPWKGCKLFERCDINVFLCARKRSGKTSTIFKILKACTGRDTAIIAFCSTIHKDSSWIHMSKYFKKKGVSFTSHTSLYDGNTNILDSYLTSIKEQIPEQDSDDEEDAFAEGVYTPEIVKQPLDKDLMNAMFGGGDDEKGSKPKKEKKKAVEYIFIFDDLSTEIKDKSIQALLKTNRHYKAMTLVSSQYPNDLTPESRKQIDVWILFKGHKEEKLKVIYGDADPGCDFEQFMQMYKHATEKPYHFLYVDCRNDKYRKDFNHEYDCVETV